MSLRRFRIGEAKGRIFGDGVTLERKGAEFACFGGAGLYGGFGEGGGGAALMSAIMNLRQRWHVTLLFGAGGRRWFRSGNLRSIDYAGGRCVP